MARAAAGEDGEKNAASAIYKRYKLSEEKTFASFFHPDKQAIIALVNQFQEKKGKFSIPGYPQKLGFLLYGVRLCASGLAVPLSDPFLFPT